VQNLILARHAESVFNVRGVLNGDPSVAGALTERGREQARALGESIAADTIDLCVTTAFERTRQTADIALEGRDVPRLVMPELDDPPNGDFELRPYSELAAWLRMNGRDSQLPGTDRSERQALTAMFEGVDMVIARPEPTVLVVAHGWFVSWIRGAALRSHQPRGWAMDHAEGYRFSRGQVERGVAELREDPYRYLPR
jgi:broad specificity phosphatase PhoE